MRVLQLQSAGIPQAVSEPRLSDLAHAPLQPRCHPLRPLLQPPLRTSLCLRLNGVQLLEVIRRRSLYHGGLHHHGRAVQTTSGFTTSLSFNFRSVFTIFPGPEHTAILGAAGALAARLLGPNQHPPDHQALLADLDQVLSLDGHWFPRVRCVWMEKLE